MIELNLELYCGHLKFFQFSNAKAFCILKVQKTAATLFGQIFKTATKEFYIFYQVDVFFFRNNVFRRTNFVPEG